MTYRSTHSQVTNPQPRLKTPCPGLRLGDRLYHLLFVKYLHNAIALFPLPWGEVKPHNLFKRFVCRKFETGSIYR
jgi:hypothetical protein